jgi:glutaredoxin
MSQVTLYTQPNCPLCTVVSESLFEYGINWIEVNILDDQVIFERYRNDIPVLCYHGNIWYYRDRDKIRLTRWLDDIGLLESTQDS